MADKCVDCNKTVKSNAQALSCDVCEKWTHRACGTGLTVAAYRKARESGNVAYICKACQPKSTSPIQSSSSTSPEVETRKRKASDKGKGKSTKRRREQLEVESTVQRVARLRNKRMDDLKYLINHMSGDSCKDILLRAAEKMPYLLFDIAQAASSQTGTSEQDHPPSSSTSTQPDWCVCSRCREMPTDEEKLCCNLMPNMCMSIRPHLEQWCLDEGVLTIAQCIRRDVFIRDEEQEQNKAFRHAAYRQYVYWQHGRLGEGNRRVIPSCVVWRIRETFPSLFGQYTGFRPGRLV